MAEKYLIERLRLDPWENDYDAAFSFVVEGYVDTVEEAHRLVVAAGVSIGDGWPIEKGKEEPRRRYRAIPRIEIDGGKDPAAVELGRKGGLKGGRARAQKLSPGKRTAIAKKAAAARWFEGK